MSRQEPLDDELAVSQRSAQSKKNVSLARRFDAASYPNPQDRIAAWRDSFSLTVDVHFDDDEIENFSGEVSYHSLGPILLVRRRYTDHAVIRSRATIDRTGKEKIILHFFRKEASSVWLVTKP